MYLAILDPFFSDKCEDIAPGAFHNVCAYGNELNLNTAINKFS